MYNIVRFSVSLYIYSFMNISCYIQITQTTKTKVPIYNHSWKSHQAHSGEFCIVLYITLKHSTPHWQLLSWIVNIRPLLSDQSWSATTLHLISLPNYISGQILSTALIHECLSSNIWYMPFFMWAVESPRDLGQRESRRRSNGPLEEWHMPYVRRYEILIHIIPIPYQVHQSSVPSGQSQNELLIELISLSWTSSIHPCILSSQTNL